MERNGETEGTKEKLLICLVNGFDMENYGGDGVSYGSWYLICIPKQEVNIFIKIASFRRGLVEKGDQVFGFWICWV